MKAFQFDEMTIYAHRQRHRREFESVFNEMSSKLCVDLDDVQKKLNSDYHDSN